MNKTPVKQTPLRILACFILDFFYGLSIISIVVDICFLLAMLFFDEVRVASNQVWLNMIVGPILFFSLRYIRKRIK